MFQCDTSIRLHDIDRRGKGETDWSVEHRVYIDLWQRRLEFVVAGDPIQGVIDPHDPYMVWYRRITRRFINPSYTPPSTHYHLAFDVVSGYAAGMVAMVDALSDALADEPTRAQVERVRGMGVATLQRYGHDYLVHPRDGHDDHSVHSQFELARVAVEVILRHPESQKITSSIVLRPPLPRRTHRLASRHPPPPRDPFTTITHYRRRCVRRRDDRQDKEPLPRINESG